MASRDSGITVASTKFEIPLFSLVYKIQRSVLDLTKSSSEH